LILEDFRTAGNLPANISARNVNKSAAKVWSVLKSLPARKLVYCEQSAGTTVANDAGKSAGNVFKRKKITGKSAAQAFKFI